MNIMFARITLAHLSGVVCEEWPALGEKVTDGILSISDYETDVSVQSPNRSGKELFKFIMQSDAYARRLIYSLQNNQNPAIVKTMIERLNSEYVKTSVLLSYDVTKNRRKSTTKKIIFVNGISDNDKVSSLIMSKLDKMMFDEFTTRFINGEYDGLFI